MKKLGDLVMILDLHRQGLKVAVIARQVGIDRKTVRKYIARGLEVPTYGPRQPRDRVLDPWLEYLKARLEAYPGLSAQRLLREISERGYAGGYSTVRDTVRALRPAGGGSPFVVRFDTPPGQQAQVDFAQFRVRFTSAPDSVQIVWLFSMVLGFSRLIWGRFAQRQTMQTVLACHRAAFEAIGGVPREILYDRMKTAVLGEDEDGRVVYNRTLGEFAHHYGFCRKPAAPIGPRPRARSSGRSAISVRTSSWAARSAISTTSTSSSETGSAASPTRVFMQPLAAWSTRRLPTKSQPCNSCR